MAMEPSRVSLPLADRGVARVQGGMTFPLPNQRAAMAFKCFASARYCGSNHTRFDLDLLPSYFTITSSTLSMLGALIVLGQWVQTKRRKQLSRSTLQDVITMWAVAELVTAVSYIVAGINYITSNRETNQCDIFKTIYKTQCFVTACFSMSGNIWTSILMVHSGLLLLGYSGVFLAQKFMPIYNIIAWICPLTIALPLLGTGKLECIGNRPLIHNLTAVSIASLLVAGPLWVIVTFAIVVIFFIIIQVQLARPPGLRRAAVWKTFLLLLLLFFSLRVWGIVQTFVSILTQSDSNGGCVPWDTHIWDLVLEILVILDDKEAFFFTVFSALSVQPHFISSSLSDFWNFYLASCVATLLSYWCYYQLQPSVSQGVGEGGQGLVLYIFCLPRIFKWFRRKLRRYTCTCACRHEYEQRRISDAVFKTLSDSTRIQAPSHTYFTLPYQYEDPSEALVAVHHPRVQFTTTESHQYRTSFPKRTTFSSIVTSGIPTDSTLLSELDLGQDLGEAKRNALISVVHMCMNFNNLKMKTLDKFVTLSLNDFQQYLLSLTVNSGPEHCVHFFDTAVVSSCETLTELFDYLDDFWDFINYDLLKCVIRMFGDDELKEDLDTYCKQFAEVQSVTTLQQLNLLMQSHPDLEIVRPHGIFVKLAVRLEANWDSYTLMDAERLRQTFISTYSLTPYSIAFSSAEEGTIVLRLWLRSECAPMIFHCKSQPIIDSRQPRILQITVDGIPYQFTRSQVVNVEVHVTATTHPGNEGSSISDPTDARPPEVDVITSDQVDGSPLDDTHLHDLMCETTNVTLEWYHLGLALGLLPHTLDAIQTQSANLITCRRSMLIEWLRQKDQVLQKGRPTWRILVKALRSPPVNRVDVANEIARKHKVSVIDLT